MRCSRRTIRGPARRREHRRRPLLAIRRRGYRRRNGGNKQATAGAGATARRLSLARVGSLQIRGVAGGKRSRPYSEALKKSARLAASQLTTARSFASECAIVTAPLHYRNGQPISWSSAGILTLRETPKTTRPTTRHNCCEARSRACATSLRNWEAPSFGCTIANCITIHSVLENGACGGRRARRSHKFV